ncbi:MAG TPA: hypothetical protein DER60_07455 [Syntrophomonas sp.]|jgi:TorA maturation chaperone TorD|nr:hypothetical protein [Syntrophomonas sp.]
MHIDDKRLEDLNANMAVFAWMSKAMDYPDEEFVESLLNNQLMENLPEERCRAFKDYIAAFDSTEALLLDLQKDYTRMCHVSKPRLVPLFESVYKEGKLFQDSTFAIARLYDEAGIRPGSEFKLPPDHIALELEFMSYLIYQEMEAIKSGNTDNEHMALRLQEETMSGHLAHFGLSVAERLSQHARSPFYQGMGDMLRVMFQPQEQPDLN